MTIGRGRRLKLIVWIVFGNLLCLPLVVPAYGESQRGAHPACEHACLEAHQGAMEQLFRQCGKECAPLEFEEKVENAVKTYERCVVNCREQKQVK